MAAPGRAGNASPAVVDGKVFVQGNGWISAFAAADGSLLWSVDTLGQLPETAWENNTAYDEFAGSPVAALGKVFWVTGHDRSPVIALDQRSGALAWASQGSTAASSRGWGSPALVDHHGRPLLLAHTGWHLLVVDPATGRVVDERETMGDPDGKGRNRGYSIGNVPVYADGLVYSSARFASPVQTTWQIDEAGCLTAAWHTGTIRPYQESMLCVDGLLFGRGQLAWEDIDGAADLLIDGEPFDTARFQPRDKSKQDGDRRLVMGHKTGGEGAWPRAQLICQDYRTGAVRGVRSDVASNKDFCGPVMACADGRIYLRWSWALPQVYLLDANAAMTVRGRFTLQLPASQPVPKKDWYGFDSPVIADGRLVIRYASGLFVFDVRRGG